jgi:outer membrane protein, multidrug efflux system
MKRFALLLFALASFLSSCKMEKITTVSEKIDIPTAWNQTDKAIDTAEYSPLKWNAFYRDTLLQDLIHEGLSNNPDMGIALQKILHNRIEVVAQKNAIAPEVALTLGGGAVRFGEYTVDGVGNFDTNLSENVGPDRQIPTPVPDYLLGAQTTWEAGLWGRYKNRKAKARAKLLAGEEGKKWVQTLLVESIASGYYQLLALDAEIAAIEKNIDLQETAVEIIKLQKEGGRVNELGVKQFEAQLIEFEALLALKKVQRAEEEYRMNALLGRTQGRVLRNQQFDSTNLPQLDELYEPSEILSNRMDIREMEYDKKAAAAEMNIAEAGFYPDLKWVGFFGVNSFSPQFFLQLPVSMAYTSLASLAAPVINRNSIKRNYRQSVAQYNIAHLEYKKRILNAIMEINTQLQRMQAFEEITRMRSEQRTIMNEGVGISNELFVSGFASYVEVLLMQSNRLQSEIAYIEALKDQYLSSIQLYKAMGGGAEGL